MRKALIGTSTLLASGALAVGLAAAPATAAPVVSATGATTASAAVSAASFTPRQSANRAALVAKRAAAARAAAHQRWIQARNAYLQAGWTVGALKVKLGAATTDEERAALYAELTDARKAHVASLKVFNEATRARTRAINAATKAAADAWRAEKAARNAERLAALARSVGISPATISAYGLSEGDISRILEAANWANTPKALSVVACESGGNYGINTGNGYYGAWQFAYGSWLGAGGGRWAGTADQAPKWAQDLVAYNYYQSAGWGPWACA